MDDLKAAALSYLNDDKFADFTIVCGKKEFKVHRCFISAHSKWFERCCAGSFAEAKDRRVELKEDPPGAVERMVHYFYEFDYDDNADASNTELLEGKKALPVCINASVYAIADKYEVPGLQKLALEKFKKAGAKALCEAERLDIGFVVKVVYRDIHLPEKDRALKNALLDMWTMAGCEFLDVAGTGSVLGEVPEFWCDLSVRLLKGLKQNEMWVRCGKCQQRAKLSRTFWKEEGNGQTIDCSQCKSTEAIAGSVNVLGSTKVSKFW